MMLKRDNYQYPIAYYRFLSTYDFKVKYCLLLTSHQLLPSITYPTPILQANSYNLLIFLGFIIHYYNKPYFNVFNDERVNDFYKLSNFWFVTVGRLCFKWMNAAYKYNMESNYKTTTHFLLFINTKSGDGHGKTYFRTPANVITIKYSTQQTAIVYLYDLFSITSRQAGLQRLVEFYNYKETSYRVIVCGGDGTIPWVLSQILNKGLDLMQIIFGIVPIGTGNDFSRSLGWGTDPVCFGQNDYRQLGYLVKQWMNSQIGFYDMWDVQIQTYEDGAIFDIKDQRQIAREQKSFKKMFSNYVGMGLDARVVYTVEKHRTSYAFLNKVVYGLIGAINFLRPMKRLQETVHSISETKHSGLPNNFISEESQMQPNTYPLFNQNLQKDSDIKEMPYPLRNGYCGLVCLNCTSYMAGLRKVWKTKSIAIKDYKNYPFKPQKVDDGLLQFVSYKNELRLALERLLPSGSRVMQGSGPFEVKMKQPKGNEITFMQIDGESIKLRNLKSIRINKTSKILDHKLRVMVKIQPKK